MKETVMTQKAFQVKRKGTTAAFGGIAFRGCNGGCTKSGCEKTDRNFSPKPDPDFTVALIGQPNTGKSTLFNAITGANQHVANWPGKTVEKKEGHFQLAGRRCHIYDLPGTYSLTANSLEEVIARDFVLTEHPDVVVVVVDASQLERSLYMVAEAIPLAVPMVIALNKTDVAKRLGEKTDAKKLAQLTGIATVPTDAATGKGIGLLLQTIDEASEKKDQRCRRPDYPRAFGPAYAKLLEAVTDLSGLSRATEWITLKLLERDEEVADNVRGQVDEAGYEKIQRILDTAKDGRLLGPKARYDWIEYLVGQTVSGQPLGQAIRQNGFDRYATHPFWGNCLALIVLSFSAIAAYLVALPLMLPGFGLFFLSAPLREMLSAFAPPWLVSMLMDGIYEGVFMATTIIGFIGGVFLVLGVLESTGYLARLAYIADPFMRRVGLHGKSIMPLLMGFICNILGVAGTRVIDSWRQRLATLLVVPVIPCKALFIVIVFIGTVFFRRPRHPRFCRAFSRHAPLYCGYDPVSSQGGFAWRENRIDHGVAAVSAAELEKRFFRCPCPGQVLLPPRLLVYRRRCPCYLGRHLLPGGFHSFQLPCPTGRMFGTSGRTHGYGLAPLCFLSCGLYFQGSSPRRHGRHIRNSGYRKNQCHFPRP